MAKTESNKQIEDGDFDRASGASAPPKESQPASHKLINEHSGLQTVRLPKLARLLNTSPFSIERWVRQGRFPKPFTVVPGGPRLWVVRDVLALFAKRKRARKPARHSGQIQHLKQYQKQTTIDMIERSRKRKCPPRGKLRKVSPMPSDAAGMGHHRR
jgi:predicted DNA-binding transcriptional regulator AlpA